ncbi:aminopeptidase N [Micromonospora sp. NBC_01813]|uniref:aminopeptidase N n=1 Tax=Micromonospora sp. NBC_01813 TaxID=2975988 RepID=UPI002DD815E1|nr:aminopeptidase N [Micromonospora sp. NBC_01813]WSA09296.1 aminopeptidase N [Micromonospora sp. NBC_01813]
MPSLTRAEATERAATITVESYTIDLDLTVGATEFVSTSTIEFRATPGAATFVEVAPVTLLRVRLNDVDLDPATLDDKRIPLTGLAGRNTLTVEARMAYSNSGQGLHRFVDPADGETYLYAMSFLDDAPSIFGCFDQPDLKAPVRLRVTAPPQWTVAANGQPVGPPVDGRWEFAPTQPLATYFVTLIAGPYHAVHAEHDGVPLALYCRRSMAAHLDADAEEIFTVTRQCLDRFHELFEVRYPFGGYGQAFLPEFNAGAMENPGLVTFRDDYIFRSVVTDSQRETRATTIAHEMAHMWFGDLVTMRWWDDLWLNESFAEYLGVRVTAEATRFTDAWTTFGIVRKAWGYAADQRPSTHPVAPEEVADAAQALLNFDGISYAKGASVLRQLVAWLGDEPFLAGLRAHFAAHRFGNATLADLLDALAKASGRDLSGWAATWLQQPQVNTIQAEVIVDEAGRYREVAVVQTAPDSHPVLRPHRIGLGLFDAGATGDQPVVRRRRLEVDLDPDTDGGRTLVPALVGEPAADLLLPNDGDFTYAKVRFDPGSAAALPALLPGLTDPLARAVSWSAVLDAVRDAQHPVAGLVALIEQALPAETVVVVVEDVQRLSLALIDRYAHPVDRPALQARLAAACARLLATAPSGGSVQLAAARGAITASADVDWLRGLLARRHVPAGLVVDAELRWLLLYRLAVLGGVESVEIDDEAGRDRSAAGEQWAARCRAAVPDPAGKERAWQAIVGDASLSNRIVEAYAQGFWQPEQAELTAPYVDRYVADMPAAARLRSAWVADRVAQVAFPQYAVSEATRQLLAGLLAHDDLTPGLRRAVVDAVDDLDRALVARRAYGPTEGTR